MCRVVLRVAAVLAISVTVFAADTSSVSYNRDIRPIFAEICFTCHGPDEAARKGDLRLDLREAALENRGGYFAIDPGNAEESELVLRILSTDPEEMMPPPDSGFTLSADEKAVLADWVDAGAEYQQHWAYLAPLRPPVPEVNRSDWPRNAIDRFILARLEAHGVAPASEATPVQLLRRLQFDLVGLPPTLKEAKGFASASLDRQYAKTVKRLLASPRYGERMAIEWLDVVRFADTNGYHSDEYRDMHPYRDYVINAFNDNKPFDEFTIEQLAGDLLDKPTIDQKIATGYNRLNQITSEGGAQPGEYLVKYMADRVRNLGSVWMGATLGCAECHDHKFDPFTAKDFYRFGSFFADLKEEGKYEHGNKGYAPFLRLSTREQARELKKLQREKDRAREETDSVREAATRREALKEIEGRIRSLEMQMASTLIAKAVTPREIRVLPRGNWMDLSGEVVEPAFPDFLPAMDTQGERATRLDLANWLVADDHPMTARVFVNRLWAQFFAKGLAQSLDDLGNRGGLPTHPELLDWLAVEFRESGWNVKHMVRLIVESSTYRQASTIDAASRAADPANALFSRQTPQRLKAELVRDNALAIAGLLDSTVGGASTKPYQPEGYYDDTYAGVGKQVIYEHDTGVAQYRRGLYTFWKRSFLHPSLLAFDAPTREECTAGRPESNTPQQALVLLNDPSYIEAAKAFATRIMMNGGGEEEERVGYAVMLALSREIRPPETQVLLALYEDHLAEFRADASSAKQLIAVGLWEPPEELDVAELAAWTSVARTILNMHETITRY